MGHKRWTTTPQKTWLIEQYLSFRVSQTESKTLEFLTSTIQAYFDKFFPGVVVPRAVVDEGAKPPKSKEAVHGVPTVSAVGEDGNSVDLLARAKVRWWFYNHRMGKGGGQADEGMFDFAVKKAPKPQLYQTYWRMNKDKVNGEANLRYTTYQKVLADDEAQGKPQPENPRKWLSFAVEVAIEFLDAAGDEEKAAVEEFREKLGAEHVGLDLFTELDGESGTATDADARELQKRAVDIQLAVNGLPKVLQNILDEIERKTGWVGSIMVGGPAPETGKLMAMITHQGRTLNLGNSFAQATDRWSPVEEAFNKFLTSCYTPAARKKLTEAYHSARARISDSSNPPAPPATPGPNDTHDVLAANLSNLPQTPAVLPSLETAIESSDAEPPEGTRDEAGNGTATTKKKKKSREPAEQSYDEFVEEQRAKARAHMAAVGALQAATQFNQHAAPKPRAPRKRKVPPTEKPTGARPQTRASAAAAATTLSAASTPSDVPPSIESQLVATDAQSSSANTHDPLPSESPALANPSLPGIPSASLSSALYVPATVTSPRVFPPLPSTVYVPPQALLPMSVSQAVSPPLPAASSISKPQSPISAPVSDAQSSQPSNPLLPPSTPLLSPRLGAPPAAMATTANMEPTSLTLEGSPTPRPSYEARKENTAHSAFTPIDEDAPSYVTDTLKYFSVVGSGGDQFAELIRCWQLFEAAKGYPGGQKPDQRLSTEQRPPEIRDWMKVGRDYENIPLIELKTFGHAWKAWWVSLQPLCRVNVGRQWPPIRVEPDDVTEWDPLWRAGPCGIFLVVLSLAWWVWAVSENEEEEIENGVTLADALEAVSDVLWVLSLAVPSISLSQPSAQKRPHPEDSENMSNVANKRICSE